MHHVVGRSPESPSAPEAAPAATTSPEVTRTTDFPWLWAGTWAVIGLVCCCLVALGPLEGVAHVQDEIAYQVQARLISEGRLWEAELTPRAAYHHQFIINADGRRWGVFPNGWPLVLALGTLLKIPWAVNPLLHGFTVVLGAKLAHGLRGVGGARLAAPLLALNPALVVLGASRMSHTLCGLLVLTCVWLVFTERRRRRTALGLGACLGFMLLVRPLDAVISGVVLASFLVWRHRRGVLDHWPALVAIAVGVFFVLLQNRVLTGDWLLFAQQLWFARAEPPIPGGFRYSETCNQLGFGTDRGCVPILGSLGHSPTKAVANAAANLELMSTLWLGHGLLAVFCIPAFTARRSRGLAILTALLLVGLFVGYAFYWHNGMAYGARFYHSACALTVVCLALGFCALLGDRRLPLALGLVPVALFAWTLAEVEPELRGYWAVDGRLGSVVERWDGPDAIVFVAYGFPRERPVILAHTAPDMRYAPMLRRGMWIQQDDSPIHFAEYHPALVEAVRRRFPERPAFVLMLTGERQYDRMVPLEWMGPLPPQADDLPVPPPLPLLEATPDGLAPLVLEPRTPD